MERRIVTHGAKETEAFARTLAKSLRPGAFLALYGDLGAGKTCFVRGLADGLGCTDPVSSPTFSIVHEYRGPVPLCHFDMYRIDVDALEDTGFYDYMDGRRIIACEWCENIADAIPEDAIRISIERTDGAADERRITVRP